MQNLKGSERAVRFVETCFRDQPWAIQQAKVSKIDSGILGRFPQAHWLILLFREGEPEPFHWIKCCVATKSAAEEKLRTFLQASDGVLFDFCCLSRGAVFADGNGVEMIMI